MAHLHRDRSFGRFAVVAGGLAVGALAGRLVPPLVAGAMGALGSRRGEDPFERLRADHRHILSLLERMRATQDGSSIRRMPLFLGLKRALGKHALAEEDIVYPLLAQHGGAAGASKHLYADHADMKIHLYELETALRAGTSWGGRIETLHGLIARHIREEEDVEFPKLRASLDATRQHTMSGQIRREEALIV